MSVPKSDSSKRLVLTSYRASRACFHRTTLSTMEQGSDRKARLKALRAAAQESGEQPVAQQPAEPVLKFRNYHVQDQKHVSHEQLAPAQAPKLEEPTVTKKPEDAAQEELLVNVAPKKANWDLKRDVQPKLDKLERRTQRAIMMIMMEQEQAAVQAEATA